jgi:anti-sigma B factor antagonist
MSFSITIEQPSETLFVLSATGELDAYTAPDVRAELAQLTGTTDALTVVCDLSAVTFLDSSGLGVLIGALKRLRESGGELRIVQPRSEARRIFSLTSLDRVLPIYETPAEAIAASAPTG